MVCFNIKPLIFEYHFSVWILTILHTFLGIHRETARDVSDKGDDLVLLLVVEDEESGLILRLGIAPRGRSPMDASLLVEAGLSPTGRLISDEELIELSRFGLRLQNVESESTVSEIFDIFRTESDNVDIGLLF